MSLPSRSQPSAGTPDEQLPDLLPAGSAPQRAVDGDGAELQRRIAQVAARDGSAVAGDSTERLEMNGLPLSSRLALRHWTRSKPPSRRPKPQSRWTLRPGCHGLDGTSSQRSGFGGPGGRDVAAEASDRCVRSLDLGDLQAQAPFVRGRTSVAESGGGAVCLLRDGAVKLRATVTREVEDIFSLP